MTSRPSIRDDESYVPPKVGKFENPYAEGVDYKRGKQIVFQSVDAMRNAMFGTIDGKHGPLHEAIFNAAVPSYGINKNVVTVYPLRGQPLGTDRNFMKKARKIASGSAQDHSVCK